MDINKLQIHVNLSRKNLKSSRVKCFVTCPFEEEIVKVFPDLQVLFDQERQKAL